MEEGLLLNPPPRRSMIYSRWMLIPVLAVVLGFHGWCIFSQLDRYGGNYSGFAVAGDKFPAPGLYPPGTIMLPNSFGYDGQFFLMAALDPLARGQAAARMDEAPYRYQRILYPWLARFMALGEAERIPAMLVMVNLLAIGAGTLLVGLMCARGGASPVWALGYGLMSGLLIATMRDLAEPVALAFMVAGIHAYTGQRNVLAALCMALALLTKEVTALALLALAVHALFMRNGWRTVFLLCLAGVPLAAWWAYIYLRLGALPFAAGQSNFGLPLAGMIAYARQLWDKGGDPAALWMGWGCLALTAYSIVLAVWEFLRRHSPWGLALLFYALFFLLMTDKVWVEPWSYGRVLLPLFGLTAVAFANHPSRAYWPALLGQMALSGVALKWLGLV